MDRMDSKDHMDSMDSKERMDLLSATNQRLDYSNVTRSKLGGSSSLKCGWTTKMSSPTAAAVVA